MVDQETANKIRKAFSNGTLRVRSVSTSGNVEWKRVEKVHRVPIEFETVWELTSDYGSAVVTGGHRIYTSPTDAVEAKDLRVGSHVLAVVGDNPVYTRINQVEQLPSREVMYDLTVSDNHNLVLERSRICGHNSPDRNYHFRPPEAEGNIGAYNRVFGYVWLDNELFEYLERGMDWWNMMPPSTGGFTLDQMVQQKPEWRTAVLWEAITHACFALACNWVVDEFSVKSNTYVRVALLDGRKVEVPIGELYELCHGPDVLDATRAAIREAYRAGTLKVEAVDPRRARPPYRPSPPSCNTAPPTRIWCG